ncbi:MAG: endonuclease/exonuclease/phosphatase family protein [Saprospiraceae bacterium]|nr:endonuclease/exonuclease/phosphatase family protein [Saprospiraceae bacterium]
MLRFLLALNIVWFFICLVIYNIVGMDPAHFWLFSIASLFIPVVFFINLLLLLFWLLFRWNHAWLPLLTIAVGWNPLLLMFSFGEPETSRKCQRDPVSIMSYNVFGLKQLRDSTEARTQMKKSRFTSFVRQYEPDILCVQEDNFFADGVINQSGIYPYFHYLIQHGAAIYSKYPILDKGRIDFGTRTNSCLWVDLLMGGKTIRVYSLHLQSNQVGRELTAIASDDKMNRGDAKMTTFRSALRKYKRNAIIRSEQARSVAEHAASSGVPCILAGDFNDTPFSNSYKILARNRSDSFHECGNGVGSTYTGLLPGLRIDYVLSDDQYIGFCSHKVLHTNFSDHNPILAKFYLK